MKLLSGLNLNKNIRWNQMRRALHIFLEGEFPDDFIETIWQHRYKPYIYPHNKWEKLKHRILYRQFDNTDTTQIYTHILEMHWFMHPVNYPIIGSHCTRETQSIVNCHMRHCTI